MGRCELLGACGVGTLVDGRDGAWGRLFAGKVCAGLNGPDAQRVSGLAGGLEGEVAGVVG